jgi:hypothetical protein
MSNPSSRRSWTEVHPEALVMWDIIPVGISPFSPFSFMMERQQDKKE